MFSNLADLSRLRRLRALVVVVACSMMTLAATAFTTGNAQASTLPAPDNLHVTDTGFDEVSLAWDRVPRAEFYRVLVDGVARSGVYDPASSVTISQLRPGVTYTFEVQARETNGEFGPSATLVASTRADNEPPTAPTGLREARDADGRSVGLTWNPSTDNWGVHGGYFVYADGRFSTVSGAPVGWTWLTDPYHGGLGCGTTYAFTVQAVDLNGNRSEHSAPLTATTPAC